MKIRPGTNDSMEYCMWQNHYFLLEHCLYWQHLSYLTCVVYQITYLVVNVISSFIKLRHIPCLQFCTTAAQQCSKGSFICLFSICKQQQININKKIDFAQFHKNWTI
uniref:Uncharacterized protein n=1 Tax=Romanomermis culicivorax TaxID=13658 RepID=A0A915KWV9_ROMCU